MTELPIGQIMTTVPPRVPFANTLLYQPLAIFRTSIWQRLFKPFKHVHSHVRIARLVDPPRDVFDCTCGDRKLYGKAGDELPYQKFLIDAGSITLDKIFADKTGGS